MGKKHAKKGPVKKVVTVRKPKPTPKAPVKKARPDTAETPAPAPVVETAPAPAVQPVEPPAAEPAAEPSPMAVAPVTGDEKPQRYPKATKQVPDYVAAYGFERKVFSGGRVIDPETGELTYPALLAKRAKQ